MTLTEWEEGREAYLYLYCQLPIGYIMIFHIFIYFQNYILFLIRFVKNVEKNQINRFNLKNPI